MATVFYTRGARTLARRAPADDGDDDDDDMGGVASFLGGYDGAYGDPRVFTMMDREVAMLEAPAPPSPRFAGLAVPCTPAALGSTRGAAGGTKTCARLVAAVPAETDDPDGVTTDGCDLPGGFELPEHGSIFCGRDHKSCHVWIPDIHCSRRQAELTVDASSGRVFITRGQPVGSGVGRDQYGQNPTKVHRGKTQHVLPRQAAFELLDSDMIVFPKEHAFLVYIERRLDLQVGR